MATPMRALASAWALASEAQRDTDRRRKALVSAMTRYSRSVIPGRPPGELMSNEIDSLVFGRKGRAAANDGQDDVDDFDDGEADHLVGRANTDRRAKVDRRIVRSRRKSEFAPLPDERRGPRAEGSKRGPILLVGAAVIVAVFGVVVWNAYREGVRPQDSNTAPQLAAAGAFKSKPETTAEEPSSTAAEASVFEQVEAPRPSIDPAPEIRDEPRPPPVAVAPPPAPSAAKPVQTPLVQTGAPATPAPAKPVAAQPPSTHAPSTQAPSTQAPAAIAPPVPTAEAPKQEAISLIAGGNYVPIFALDGKYVVQIAAASTEAGANAEWNKRIKAMPELFSAAAEKIIVQADVNGRTVYRVRVGAFATAANADAFCSAIKAKGGACFRTAR